MKPANIIMLLVGISISMVAAFFSVAGLAAIFAATFIQVIIMGAVLEAGKIAAATWLHYHWKHPLVGRLHKTYMAAAVVALMLITSLGIYGYLSKGHLEQQAPVAGIELQIDAQTTQITQLQTQINADDTRLRQLDAAVDSMIAKDKSAQAMRYRNSQRAERIEIQKDKATAVAQINALNTSLLPLRTQVNEVETKLGPIKYVAQLFGIKDTEGAVRIVIILIMLAFDPLAIILIISATMKLEEDEKTVDNLAASGDTKTDSDAEQEIKIDLQTEVLENIDKVSNTDGQEEIKSWLD